MTDVVSGTLSARSRNWAIGVATALGFLVVMGSNAVSPVLALDAKAMGASSVAVGILFGSLYAVRFIVGPTVGALSDKRGLRWTLRACLLVSPIVPVVYAYAPDFVWLMVGRILSGIVSSAFSPIILAYLGIIAIRGKEGTVTGIYNASYWIAFSLGAFVSGVLADHWGFRASFNLFLALSLIAGVVVFLLPREQNFTNDEPRPATAAQGRATGRRVLLTCLATPLSVGLLAANFAQYMNSSTIAAFFPLFGHARSYSITEIGLFMGVLGSVGAVFQLVFGRLSDRVGPDWLLLMGSLVLCLGFILLVTTTPFITAVFAAAVLALGLAAMQASLTTSAVVFGRQVGMGAFMGIFYSSQALGNMLGPVLSGVISEFGNYSVAFGPPAALAVLGAVVHSIAKMRGAARLKPL